nr:retrovirus-related Pol polyprotein from transposon TNT 1-94 [Tanacetum cinerariifolium]
MSGAIPPIPPPFGASSSNLGSPNANRVDTMPTTTCPINTTTTTNVARNVVDENLPQLLDSRGESHVTNVLSFDKEDFTSWKVRFLVFLDGLEPYLLKTLEYGPFVLMSSLSTSENSLPKRQNQWSNAETHEGPSDTRDTKIAALRLKFNDLKSLEGEKVIGTFTRLKCLLKDLENNGVTIPQAEVNAMFVNSLPRKWLSMNETQRENNSIKNESLATLYGMYNYKEDVEEDQRTNNEFMADLNAEYHERALLSNQKRFYKRPRRVRSARKPIDKTKETCFACGKTGHFQKDRPSNKTSTPSYPSSNNSFNKFKSYTPPINQTSSHNTSNYQKDYKGKYKGLKAEMVDEGTTKIRAFMAIAEDEPSMGKADARSGEWVDIIIKKVHRLVFMTDSDDRKHVLDYTHVDLIYVEDQRKNMVNKYNILKQELSLHKSELSNLKNTVPINCSLQNEVIRVNLENESLKDEISELKRVIEKWTCNKVTVDQMLSEQIHGNIVKALEGKGKRKENYPSKEVLFTKADVSTSESAPLPSLPKLTGADPSSASKNIISLSDLNANMDDLTLNTASKEIKKSSNKVSQTYVIKKRTESKHLAIQNSCPDKNALPSTKQLLDGKSKRYSKELCPKVVFGDDSSGNTEGYGPVNCNGITFTKVTYVNGLKYNLISINQLKMENLNEVRVKELRSDNGTNFKNHKLEELCDEKGSSQNFSSPYTPKQNGVAERRNRTLIEANRTISIIVKRHGKTAYDVFRGRYHDISYFYVFGCPVHIHNHRDHFGKFDEKADDGFFLGYSPVAKAFRVFDIKDYVKMVKNQSKPDNIGHKIGSLHQKPDQRAFFYNNQANEAKCQKIESSRAFLLDGVDNAGSSKSTIKWRICSISFDEKTQGMLMDCQGGNPCAIPPSDQRLGSQSKEGSRIGHLL